MSVIVSDRIPGGSVEVVAADRPDDVRLRLRRDPGPDALAIGYYSFMAIGGRDRHWRFAIENVGSDAGARLDGRDGYEDGWTGTGPHVSYDRREWFRIPGRLEGTRYVFEHRPTQDVCFYARWATYSPDDELALLARASGSPLATVDVVGTSVQGRAIPRIRIGTPAPGRRNVWIVARQHPSETMASFFVEGVVDRLLDGDDPVSRRLLAGAVVHVVPNINPDGAALGHTRANAAGANLNREWATPTLEASPEVVHVRGEMERTGVDFFLDCHGDEELRCVFLGGPLEIPSRSARLAQLFRSFELAWNAASPDYELGHPYPGGPPAEADLRMAWNWVAERFDCLSVLLEQPFKDTSWAQDPRTGWSPARARRLGLSFPTALGNVLGSLR
jgi:murein tripeptide amidase MpaA